MKVIGTVRKTVTCERVLLRFNWAMIATSTIGLVLLCVLDYPGSIYWSSFFSILTVMLHLFAVRYAKRQVDALIIMDGNENVVIPAGTKFLTAFDDTTFETTHDITIPAGDEQR